jgi:transposase
VIVAFQFLLGHVGKLKQRAGRLKNFRRVATRCAKLAETFFGFVGLASTLVSLLW